MIDLKIAGVSFAPEGKPYPESTSCVEERGSSKKHLSYGSRWKTTISIHRLCIDHWLFEVFVHCWKTILWM